MKDFTDEQNKERCDLIDKEVNEGGLSPAEKERLEILTESFLEAEENSDLIPLEKLRAILKTLKSSEFNELDGFFKFEEPSLESGLVKTCLITYNESTYDIKYKEYPFSPDVINRVVTLSGKKTKKVLDVAKQLKLDPVKLSKDVIRFEHE